MWRNTCHKEKHKSQKDCSIAQRRRVSLAYSCNEHCTALAIYWTSSLGALSCFQAMRRHIEELLKLSHESGKVPRTWSASFSSRSLPIYETPQKQWSLNSLKKHVWGVSPFMNMFHHLWWSAWWFFTSSLSAQKLRSKSRSLAPSKLCGRTWRAVIIWWRTGSPESVLWKWYSSSSIEVESPWYIMIILYIIHIYMY